MDDDIIQSLLTFSLPEEEECVIDLVDKDVAGGILGCRSGILSKIYQDKESTVKGGFHIFVDSKKDVENTTEVRKKLEYGLWIKALVEKSKPWIIFSLGAEVAVNPLVAPKGISGPHSPPGFKQSKKNELSLMRESNSPFNNQYSECKEELIEESNRPINNQVSEFNEELVSNHIQETFNVFQLFSISRLDLCRSSINGSSILSYYWVQGLKSIPADFEIVKESIDQLDNPLTIPRRPPDPLLDTVKLIVYSPRSGLHPKSISRNLYYLPGIYFLHMAQSQALRDPIFYHPIDDLYLDQSTVARYAWGLLSFVGSGNNIKDLTESISDVLRQSYHIWFCP